MAGGSSGTNPPKPRKRVEADSAATASLKRAKDGSAFARCDECKSSVPVALIDFHSCSLEAKIKMSLEAQVAEKPAEVKKKPVERKKSASSGDSEPKSKKRKLTKVKDPNQPKRPPTAYFLFMDDFRKTFKEEHPDSKGVKEVAKEAGEKWRSMTDEEKKPYQEKAAELKAEYEKAMEAYNSENKEESGDEQAEELCDEDA